LKTLEWAGLNFDKGKSLSLSLSLYHSYRLLNSGLHCVIGPGKQDSSSEGGPYFQSQRKAIYDKHLQTLIDSEKAYHCFCTPERLTKVRKVLQKQGGAISYDRKCLGLTKRQVDEKLSNGEKSVIRFNSSSSISKNDKFVQKDLIYDEIVYEKGLPIEDFVLRKTDGLPTYHFASVVDDHSMKITHVLRGEEWLPSTPKHLQLYKALQWRPPLFGHLPLLVNPDGSKLSKRTGDVAVEKYIEKGYEPSALLNFVALLGWSPQHTTTINNEEGESQATATATDLLPLNRLIEQFSLSGINKNRPTLQQGKLDWLNRNHIKMKLFDRESQAEAEETRRDLTNRLRKVLINELFEKDEIVTTSSSSEEDVLSSDEYLLAVIDTLKDRLHTIKDIPSLGRYFFIAPNYDSKTSIQIYSKSMMKDSKLYREILSHAIPIISSLPNELFSRELSLEKTPKLEQELLVSLSSISIVSPSPSPSSTVDAKGAELEDKEISRKKASQIMSPLRHALTGQKVGASVAATVRVLGRDETKRRFERAIQWSLNRDEKAK